MTDPVSAYPDIQNARYGKGKTMAATPKQMATSVDSERFAKITSVTAHMVQSIAVQMSVTEMEALIESFGKAHYELSDTEKALQREFADAVYALR